MRTRIVTLLGFVIAVTAIAITGQVTHLHLRYTSPIIREKLPAKVSSYLGVFEPNSPPGYGPITGFASVANRRPNLVGYYSGWAEPFDSSFADLLHQHGAIPFVQIDPTFASVSGIASGFYDDYLQEYADSVRDYHHAVVIGFGHEMNGSWYPWGYGHVPPATFVAAWRHIVTLFNREGAQNVTWLWTVNQVRKGTGPIAEWWPGGKYVTWVGIDGFYVKPSDDFYNVFGRTIQQVRALTKKPILLSETGVGPRTNGPRTNQFLKVGDLFAGMHEYKTLGLVWFDKDQSGSLYREDWRLEGDTAASAAFSLGVRKMR